MEASEEMGLSSLLSSPGRDFLISSDGSQIGIGELEGKTIGLYFSANWNTQCESFTPVLADVYNQLKADKSPFEVVYVSSDEDQRSFDRFHGLMPWLAVPFSDLQCKKSLTQRFQIEAVPSLIMFDPNGETLQMEGVEIVYRYGARAFPFTCARIEELEAEERVKHESQTLETLLSTNGRSYVISHSGQVPIRSLEGKTIGLYFSAHHCPPCLKFTSKLVSIYNNLKSKNDNNKEFEIIFVSADRNKEAYTECYKAMPWLTLPYEKETSKALLKYFHVLGIPSLIILSPDGKTITKDGRYLINLYADMAYPFTEERIRFLQERLDEEAKAYPRSVNHVNHRHELNLVSEGSGGGPFICCECDEQGLGWEYQCLECGYEIHPRCIKEEATTQKIDE
ncbi:putative nucleoredoxin 2 [Acorus calamus]|uniref:protein-disulfide reductase n=1 Tax=Acorus calamus TaxID=4465 RepID=A0AAV9E6X8_ACOCL|nr:putative nucleoredoxin 2 [Acorus calamus]